MKSEFNLSETAELWGVRQGSRQMRRLLDAIFPNRPRLQGVETYLQLVDVWRGAVVDQLIDHGCNDGMATVISAGLARFVSSDLEDGRDPGFLLLCVDTTGVVVRSTYVARKQWEREVWDSEMREMLSRADEHGRDIVVRSLVDLSVITKVLVGRLGATGGVGRKVSSQAMIQAFKDANVVRDKVNDAELEILGRKV